jgi:prepilin peptidase CpaA
MQSLGHALQSFHMSFMLIAAALMVAAALHDLRTFRIPNWIWMGLLAVFPLYVISAPHEIPWLQHLGVCAIVLIIGFFLFAGNFAGAGDVKLLAAVALWVGPNLVGVLLVVTALVGGLLAVLYALASLWRQQREQKLVLLSGTVQALTKTAIPYGVAIACGGLTAFGMIAAPLF